MTTRDFLLSIYWRIRRLIAPNLMSSQYMYENVLKSFVNKDSYWLDIGCGHQVLPKWRSEEESALVRSCKFIVGIDYDMYSLKKHKNIDHRLRSDIVAIPFKSGIFDLATANMVVEHLDYPEPRISEILRILKPGGIFIFHTPNKNNLYVRLAALIPERLKAIFIRMLEGRNASDTFKTYYRLNSRKSIIEQASLSGFQVCEIKMIASTPMFAVIIPVAILELIWIRLTMTRLFKPFRSNIIAILKKSNNYKAGKSPNNLNLDRKSTSL